MRFFCFFLFFVFFASAQEKPLYITGKDISKISLHPSKKLKWEGPASHKKEKDKETLNVRAPSIKIYTPSRALYIILDAADRVAVESLKEVNLTVSLRKGSIQIQNTSGVFKISLDEGRLDFNKNKGKARIQSYSASLHLSEFRGNAEIRTYSQNVQIHKSQGVFDIQSFSSPLVLNQSGGELRFRCEKSNVQLKKYKGRIAGYTNKGKVSGSLTPKEKTEIETGSGSIHLYFASSAARVEAQSWEGKVFAPAYFYKDRAGGVYKAYGFIKNRGKNRGKNRDKNRGEAAGRVYLKSHSGRISIL